MAVQLPQSFLRADIEEFNQVPCRSDPFQKIIETKIYF